MTDDHRSLEMKARNILDQVPPPTLYHYTTQSGFLGILDSGELWATHTQYLNDQREFRHALTIIEEELTQMIALPEHRPHAAFLNEAKRGLKYNTGNMNVCVSSFSEDGDILSQWRAYGGPASGFSIGFSGKFLRAVCVNEGFWLVRCIYDETEQRALMRSLLEDVLDEHLEGRYEGAGLPPGGSLIGHLNRYAPMLKHASFSEEKEWRIISTPLNCHSPGFGYRSGRSMLTPYYRVRLATGNCPLQIKRVVVGPTPFKTQARRSTQGVLVKYGLRDAHVRSTIVPYRNW